MKNDDKNGVMIEQQRRKLERWLKEWELAQILRLETDTNEEQTTVTEAEKASVSAGYMDSSVPPKAGQIRLLFPVLSGAKGERPIYVVILEECRAKDLLIAPFGMFAEPALPGEWLTGLKAMPLRVLCLWNSRVVTAGAMGRSWMAGRMEKRKIQQALEVYHHCCRGAPLIFVSESKLGPPVRHPLDPRLRYQAEEAEIMDEHLITDAAGKAESVFKKTKQGDVYEIGHNELRLAAESRAPYGRKSKRRKKKD